MFGKGRPKKVKSKSKTSGGFLPKSMKKSSPKSMTMRKKNGY